MPFLNTPSKNREAFYAAVGRAAVQKLKIARETLRLYEQYEKESMFDDALVAKKELAKKTVDSVRTAVAKIGRRRESTLLYYHLFYDRPLTDIAITLNVSERTVYRLHKKALVYLGEQLASGK